MNSPIDWGFFPFENHVFAINGYCMIKGWEKETMDFILKGYGLLIHFPTSLFLLFFFFVCQEIKAW